MYSEFLLVAVNAKYIHSNLAVYDLAAYAGKHGIACDYAEYTINQQSEEVLRSIYERKPSLVGFSCYIWSMEYIRELLWELHAVLPDTKIWLGGPEVGLNPGDRLKEFPFIEGIMVGEGEKTWFEILSLSKRHKTGTSPDYSVISGLWIRDSLGQEVFTGPRESLSMDELAFPYGDFSVPATPVRISDFENRIIYYETSRGCPFSCSYCLSSVEKNLRFRELSLVFKELDFFLSHRVKQVKFIDRTFNCNHRHAYEIWKYLHTHDNGVTNFHFEISADLLRPEDLKLMKAMRPGLIQLEIGVQTTNPDTIDAIGRHMDLKKLKENVLLVGSVGNIHQHLDLIAGLPREGLASFRRSFNDVYAMKPDQLQLGFLKVLHGTRMEAEAKEHGILYRHTPVYEVLSTKWLSYDEVLLLKDVEACVEDYYNSGQFKLTLAYLMGIYENPFDFYAAFGSFLRKRGDRDRSVNRMGKYEALYEYACGESASRTSDARKPGQAVDTELLKILLSCDYLRRERLKQVPLFLPDQRPCQEALTRFYAGASERFGMTLKNFKTRYQVIMTERDYRPPFEKGPFFLVFDYEMRDCMDHNAEIMSIKSGS